MKNHHVSSSLAIFLALIILTPSCQGLKFGLLIITSSINDAVTVTVQSQNTKPIVRVFHVNDTDAFELAIDQGGVGGWNISAKSHLGSQQITNLPLSVQTVQIVQILNGKAEGSIGLGTQMIALLNSKPDPKVDTAALLVINNSTSTDFNFFVNGTYDDCYDCLPWQLEGDSGRVYGGQGEYLRVRTTFGLTLDRFMGGQNRSTRRFPNRKYQNDETDHYTFQERAQYLMLCFDLSVGNDIHITCHLTKYKEGISTYAALGWAALAIILFTVFITVFLILNRRYHLLLRMQCRTHDRLVNADLGSTDRFSRSGSYFAGAPQDQQSTEAASALQRNPSITSEDRARKRVSRLRSLDTFRGISLSIMIFVNYEGGKYWFFNHSRWNGLTVADCVFPWFMWIMGTSMVISMRSQKRKNISKSTMIYKVVRRSIILFCLGLFLNNGYDLAHWRIPGVLQRFGISYLVVGIAEILLPTVVLPPGHVLSPIQDIVCYPFHWLFMALLLIIHTAITFGLKVPGCPTGYIGPGGIGDQYKYPDCTAGAAGYLDKKLFGNDHIYQHPTCSDVYKCGPYDPEGALGSLTSIFLVFLGVQAGRILVLYEKGVPHVARWMIWGSIVGAIGTGLCGASQDTGVIPINKNLWSLSFVLVLGAGAFILLTFCYVICDMMQIWNGAPFFYPGMNSILVYCGSELLEGFFPFSFKVDSTHGGILANSIIGVTCWLVVAFYLHSIKFFVKI